MKKRNIRYWWDYLFWYLIYLLPILVLLFSVFRTGELMTLSDVFDSLGLNIVTDNVVYKGLVDLFGVASDTPQFVNNGILEFASYFVLTFILHIAVDVLLFIPRFAHEFLEKAFKGVDD